MSETALISRQEAIDELIAMREHIDSEMSIIGCAAYEMAIEALREPERKTGRWILTEDDDYEYCTCSECGYQNGENWMNGSDIPFCAMCGADMRGEADGQN